MSATCIECQLSKLHVDYRCCWILSKDGALKPFSSQDQDNLVKTVIEPMASDGLRTLCVAYKDFVSGWY